MTGHWGLFGLVVVGTVATSLSIKFETATAVFLALALTLLYLVPVDNVQLGKFVSSVNIDLILLGAAAGIATATVRGLAPPLWFTGLLCAIVALGVITLAFESNNEARRYLTNFVMVGAMLSFIAGAAARSRQDLWTLSRCIMWAGGLASILGIIEYIEHRNPFYGAHYPPALPNADGALYFANTSGFRITSSIGHPVNVAAVLTLSTIVAVGIALATTSDRERKAAWTIVAAGFTAVMMTKTRTAIAILPAGLLIAVLFGDFKRPSAKRILLILAGLAFALWMTRGIWLERLSDNNAGSSSTNARRIGLEYIQRVLPNSLPFGLGFEAANHRVGGGQFTVNGASAENGWLELLVDAGPLFVLAMLTAALAPAITLLNRARRVDPLLAAHAIGLLGLFIAAASVNSITVSRVLLFCLFIEAGICASALQMLPRRASVLLRR